MFFSLSICLFSVGLVHCWQGSTDSHCTGWVHSILWCQSTLHWSLYLRGVLSKQVSTTVTFWKWIVLKILFSKAVWGQAKSEKLHASSKHRRTLNPSLSMIQWRNRYWTWITAHLCFLQTSSKSESWFQASNLSKIESVYIHPKPVPWLFSSLLPFLSV